MQDGHVDGSTAHHVCLTVVACCALTGAIAVTSLNDNSSLGAPGYWTWILTGIQVSALGAASAGKRFGWLLGAFVQVPWIAYALFTAQIGFIPGCVVSCAIQTQGYLGRRRSSSPIDVAAYT